MILESDVAFMVLTAAVVQEFEGERPFLLAELAGLEHVGPLLCPQMVLNYVNIILSVNDSALVNHDLALVPFAVRFLVLRFCRNHVIEGSRLSVAVYTEFRIRMVCIVKNLILRA